MAKNTDGKGGKGNAAEKNKGGRPRKEVTKDVKFELLIVEDDLELIRIAAEKDDRSVAAFFRIAALERVQRMKADGKL